MHPRVNDVFKEHQEWLDKGGSQSILAVQNANLVAMMDQALNACEAEAYQRGSSDGYRVGVKFGWDDCVKANTGPGSPPLKHRYQDLWRQEQAEMERRILERAGTVNDGSFDAGGRVEDRS